MNLHYFFGVAIAGRVQHRMRMGVPRQESLQPYQACAAGYADDHRATGAGFEQRHAPQDEGAHDALAELGLRHHHRAQRGRIDQ